MFAYLITLLLLSRLSFCASLAGPIVDTGYARYLGKRTLPHTAAFLGIPYAEPPVGDGRFRAPIPLNTSRLQRNKIIDVTTYPDFCIQGSTGDGDAGGAGSEDCLKVNIYAPVNATKDSKLPVLVYIHGGSYLFGNPAQWPFDHWIEQSPNVVIVSVYYRLTVFGFLAHPALASDPTLGTPNAGFLDQIEALRWVNAHIGAFGGDPGRVTLNGQSAGGSSIALHMVVNGGNASLFTGVITQSIDRIGLPTLDQQVPLFNFLLQNTSCTEGTIVTQMACLRNASVSSLIRSADSAYIFPPNPFWKWIPVVDNVVFTDIPTKLVLDGKWAKVPVLAGSTSNETLSLGNFTANLQQFYPTLTNDDIQQFMGVYPEREFASEKERNDTMTGEPALRCGRELMAGAAESAGLPSFGYRYNQPNPTGGDTVHVEHTAENWMMFLGTNTGFNGSAVFTGLDPVQKAFSEELIAYWLSFVRSSDPNTFKLARSPEWQPFSLAAPPNEGVRQVLQQDPDNTTTTSGVRAEGEPQVEVQRCGFVFTMAGAMEN